MTMGKIPLDENGQPPLSVNFANNEIKAVNTLYGLIMGISADNKITDEEVHFLNLWLVNNDTYLHAFPLNAVNRRVNDILADGIITHDEREDFQQLLSKIIGGTFQETGSAGGLSTGYNIEEPDRLVFEGSKFCLTGAFASGTRSKCTQLIVDLGGIPITSVTRDLNYLVIGALSSRDWIASSHGRKIEKALYYKEQGQPVAILSEETWVKFINIDA
jgi:NAD-dependent DNA ligase